jgi:hypothetical protein
VKTCDVCHVNNKVNSDGGKSDVRFLNEKLVTRMIALAKCTILIRLRSAALDPCEDSAMRLVKGNDRGYINVHSSGDSRQ